MATATNIVRLPTAAARKVKQPYYSKAVCAEITRLRAEAPDLQQRHNLPVWRLSQKRDAIMASLVRTPELCVMLAMYQVLDDETKQRVDMHVAVMAGAAHDTAAMQALFLTAARGNKFADLHKWSRLIERAEL